MDLEITAVRLVALLLDVFHHHLIGDIARAGCKVASGPEVSSPKLAVQLLEIHQDFTRRPTLDRFDQITDLNVERNR